MSFEALESVLLEGVWLSNVAYLEITLDLLACGVPFKNKKSEAKEPPQKKQKLEQLEAGPNYFAQLPDELIWLILVLLDERSLLSLGQTSSNFRTLTNKDELWAPLFELFEECLKKIRKLPDELSERFRTKLVYFVQLAFLDFDERLENTDCVMSCVQSLTPKGLQVHRLLTPSQGFIITPNDSGWQSYVVPGPCHAADRKDNCWHVMGVPNEDKLPSLTAEEAKAIRNFATEELRIPANCLQWAIAMGVGKLCIERSPGRKINELKSQCRYPLS